MADVKNCSIEAPWPFEEKFFDYILFGDILQRLKDPWQVLRMAKNYIRPGGYLLGTVPNLTHYSVLTPLLKGNFTYEDEGILKRSHLRFFTYNSLLSFFETTDYENPLIIYRRLYDEAPDAVEQITKLNEFAGNPGEYHFFSYLYHFKAQVKSDQ